MPTINKGDLPRYENGEYGQSELTQAVANAEVAAFLNPSSGGGGGGGGLTNTQLRATPVPVSLTTLPTPPGLVWESTDTITITRAAMTTYMASWPNFDVYGGLFELQNIGQAGKGIFLTFFEIDLTLNAVPLGMTSFQVFLSPTAPTSIADNSIFTLNSGAYLDKVGFTVSMSLGRGGNSVVGVVQNLNHEFILTSTSLWGYLVTNGAIQPTASSETGTIRARSLVI